MSEKSRAEAEQKEYIDLSTYEIHPSDFERIFDGVAQLRTQNLLEEETLKGLRFLTCDAHHLYVFSTEPHVSMGDIAVEELAERDGMHVYRLSSQEVGAYEGIYQGGSAWWTLPELEQTAFDATRVPNPKTTKREEKNDILKVVFIPPSTAFESVNVKQHDYASSLIAHEAGHIEEMRYRDWPNEGEILPFPDEDHEKAFAQFIQDSGVLPPMLSEELLPRIDRATMGELYSILVERESRRLSNTEDKSKFPEYYKELTADGVSFDDEHISALLSSSHIKADVLAHALEAAFPDHTERMRRMRELITTPKPEE
jgi:hypothetical protein